MLPFSDPLVAEFFPSVSEEEWRHTWWLVLHDGTPLAGNRGGGLALLSEVKMTRPIGRMLALFHLSPALDALDRRFAAWRRWLSRFVPEGSAPRRYP